ncbi:Oleosin [Corchorus olitorius]|uniref:Oleosin n=1 Tax=Corchorus olitorius TaxID=93759 RepID=A0A1R3KIQ9_9ROSI|nr:Oleosin [Corchorus olitorius]
MAEGYEQQKVSGRSMVWASVAGVAVTAPLLGMMGFSFLATVTLLVVSSPLLLIMSPLLVGVGLVFGFALVGFGVAAAMALAGVSTLAWMYREVRSGFMNRGVKFGIGEQGKDRAGYGYGYGYGSWQQNSPMI